jgi:hypothetical protein
MMWFFLFVPYLIIALGVAFGGYESGERGFDLVFHAIFWLPIVVAFSLVMFGHWIGKETTNVPKRTIDG